MGGYVVIRVTYRYKERGRRGAEDKGRKDVTYYTKCSLRIP